MQLYSWHCVVRHNVMLPVIHYASTSLIPNLLCCVIGDNTLHCTLLPLKQRQFYCPSTETEWFVHFQATVQSFAHNQIVYSNFVTSVCNSNLCNTHTVCSLCTSQSNVRKSELYTFLVKKIYTNPQRIGFEFEWAQSWITLC